MSKFKSHPHFLGPALTSLLVLLHPCLGHCSSLPQSPQLLDTVLASCGWGIGACFLSQRAALPPWGAEDPAPWGPGVGTAPWSGQRGLSSPPLGSGLLLSTSCCCQVFHPHQRPHSSTGVLFSPPRSSSSWTSGQLRHFLSCATWPEVLSPQQPGCAGEGPSIPGCNCRKTNQIA